MGMHEYPSSGYVVEASQFTATLPESLQEQFRQHIDDCDWQAAQELLFENIPGVFPPLCQVFVLGDEDTPDGEMERGTPYALFCEEDLYTRTPTPAMLALQKAGIKIEHHNWTHLG